ncbi:PepSY-associated TM helix domain-containing protein [Methylobacterium sp. 17Sr1-1]|uniref:PepSY-associated TM helix domain-containing protein n=1 Tax=Methylobacterium sp. 17Sr1-1 TaxID=2202826 RepID=UPI0026A29287
MKRGFRQSMAWLHTWSGLVVGWVLFAVFVTGTATYYRAEISRWMQPELRREATITPEALAVAAERAVAHLSRPVRGTPGPGSSACRPRSGPSSSCSGAIARARRRATSSSIRRPAAGFDAGDAGR